MQIFYFIFYDPVGKYFWETLVQNKTRQKRGIFLSQERILLTKYFGYRRSCWGGTNDVPFCCSKFRVMRSAAKWNHNTLWGDSNVHTTHRLGVICIYSHLFSHSVLLSSISWTPGPFKTDDKLSIDSYRVWTGSWLAIYVCSISWI